MAYVDFVALKQRVSIEQAAQYLLLKGEEKNGQLRCICPIHGGSRGLVITYEKGLFICMATSKGGDAIGLVAHIHQCSNNEAANALNDAFPAEQLQVPNGYSSENRAKHEKATAPQKPQGRSQPARAPFDPEKFAAKLVYSDEVAALGISEDTAVELGIGFHPQRKKVYFPIRHEDGSKSGFIGCDADQKLALPPQWLPSSRKVVAMKRPA